MSVWPADWLRPNWPAPAWVNACVTTRTGGVSTAPFNSFNLGEHVGDDPLAVQENRLRLQQYLACQPVWLTQVHSATVVEAKPTIMLTADASWTAQSHLACTVLTADCLPVLFCDQAGTRIAAAHAGWRGLAGGILEATLQALALPPKEVLVWLGPAIGPAAFEVGPEVRKAFIQQHSAASVAFCPSYNAGHYWADLYQLARIRLAACGVQQVYGGGLCTYSDSQRFYSYRRDQQTGRQASLIWLAPLARV